MQLLIVEDDRFYARLISERLQDLAIDVKVVQSAEEAVSTDLTNCDGAIVDLMLPNNPEASEITDEECRGGFHTGIAVARRLLKKKPALRIIILSADVGNTEAEKWASERSIPFVSKHDGYEALLRVLKQMQIISGETAPLSFIVHGHDSAAVHELKNYIQNTLKWREPVVLREQASLGKTLIEKFEEYARRIDCVFVLLTPDDDVVASGTTSEKRRSRQNVIFELGFFYASLERKSGRILLLHKGPVELPSDISGIVWIDITNGIAAAGEEIRKEVETLSYAASKT
jgi:CheY-like chemotaxis protein